MALRFTLRQMEYLVAVGDCGSIALAASRLNVSSPTISTAITKIEAEFGLPIFLRKHAQGMVATPAGQILIRDCAGVLQAAARLSDLAHQLTGRVGGRLNLGCLLTFAQILVPQLRRSFTGLFPEVSFAQFELHQAALIEGLRDARLDVALTYDLAIPSDLAFVPIAVLTPYVLVSPAHPLARFDKLCVADLCDFPMILLDLPLSSDYFLSFLNKTDFSPRIAERAKDMAVVQSLVANDFGYSIANIRPLSNRAPDGKPLRFIPLVGDVRPMQLGLLSGAGGDARKTLRAFSTHCQQVIPGLLASTSSTKGHQDA